MIENEESKEEQEALFEKELLKTQCNNASDDDDSDDDDETFCRACQRMMSRMRKMSVRWLYLEWYKKAVIGLSLPTISELTPTLANVLKEANCECDLYCKNCETSLSQVIDKTLQPMTSLSEMYSSLPRNWTTGRDKRQSLDNRFLKVADNQCDYQNGSSIQLSNEKENITPAASFFVRAAQKLNLASKPKSKKSKKKKDDGEMENTSYVFPTNFSDLIMRTPPQAPPSLFKNGTVRRGDGHGKVRLVLRIVNRKNKPDTCLTVDSKKKQVLLRESTVTCDSQKRFEKAPRLYSFDNIYESDTQQRELCSGTLTDLLHTVVNGNDACLLTYGYPKLGKSSVMIGHDGAVENIGIIPCAISWLYQLIDDRKQRTGARFSIRVSAVEVVGKSENLKDLLGEQGNSSVCSSATSPSVYLPRERASTIQLSDFTELRAPNAEKAAFFFDAAVAARTSPHPVLNENGEFMEDPEERKNPNLIFTLHVYQYMIDKVGTGEIHGGRSRLHLIDLSGCSRKKRSRDTGQGTWLPLSALGNVIVSLSNGAKHIPHRDSKLTTLLREAMGSLSARVTMIANVSQDPKHCFETLSTFQVASRIHRSRKKKSRYSSTSSSGGDSSCDEKRKHRRRCKPVTPLLRTEACQSDHLGESEFTSTSAAEESCDTVIYVGPRGGALSDRELTDFEHPPNFSKRTVSNKDRKSKIVSLPEQLGTPGPKNACLKSHCKSTLKPKSNSKNDSTEYKKQLTNIEVLEKPIVVTIKDSLLKSPLEEKADSIFALPKKHNQSQDDTWVPHGQKQKCIETWNSCTYSESLPIRSKNRCYSVETADDVKHRRSYSLRLNKTKTNDRQCVSTNSSPVKQSCNLTRTSSLDRLLGCQSTKPTNQNVSQEYKSTDTLSSMGTVENFERQLVSKIAERFALEDEFTYVDDVDSHLFTNEIVSTSKCASEEFYIDDDLESIAAELEPSSIDNYNSYNYITEPLSTSKTSVEESEQRYNEVIPCNNCIGECNCGLFSDDNGFVGDSRYCDYDSAEDTDEQTDKQLRLRCLRNRNSFSSCDSHLDHSSPRGFSKRPPSEGVSSGYESMRCESSANIHDSSSEKVKPIRKEKTNIIYEIQDETQDSSIDEEDLTRFARTTHHRSQIKGLIEQRQDLKEQLHQTLKKLVLNKVPLPDIDERLREITLQSKDTQQILTRENRILERKIKVCKSHLQLVNYLDNSSSNTVTPSASPKKKNPYQKFSAKLKAKLSRSSPRKSYKTTAV